MNVECKIFIDKTLNTLNNETEDLNFPFLFSCV